MKSIKFFPLLLVFSILFLTFSGILFFSAFSITNKDQLTLTTHTSGNPLQCKELNCSPEFFSNEQRILEYRLKEEEAESIYSDILNKYADSSPNNQHAIAHIFGELLYKNQGVSGIIVCDNSFAFGCFHGLFAKAISKEGLKIVYSLDQNCIEKYGQYNLGCQHGLGHGLAEYYGPQNLDAALKTCSTLSWKHPLMGCASGVFMEQITPTVKESLGSTQIKPVNYSEPYAPCLSIDEYFKPECFYNLGNYYYHALNKDLKAGLALCQDASNETYRKFCLLGFGNSAYSITRDISKTISQCQANGNQTESYCRAGAAWILYSDPSTNNKSHEMCSGLNTTDFKECEKNTNLLNLALEL